MPLTAKIKASIEAIETGTNDYGTPRFTPQVSHVIELINGTVADAADRIFVDERTVASATNDDIDLAGVLVGALGSTITFVEIVAILIINRSKAGVANTTNLTIGVGTNPFVGFLGGTTPTIGPIRPGGFVMIGCPADVGIGTVTAGTADILRIANSSGAAATYQIAIIGRSA